MIRGYGAETIRAAEAPALAAGVPLMREAAFAVARVVATELDARGHSVVGARVLVLVGGGNNGGDGLYCAADLVRRGVRVTAALLKETVHPGGLAAARRAGVRLLPPGSDELVPAATAAQAWVDAAAGIGVRGGLRGAVGETVGRLGHLRDRLPQPPLVVAVDTPSGVDADGGALAGPVLPADVTVTMGGAKAGLLLPPAAALAGRVDVVDLGLEEALLAAPAAVRRLTGADVADLYRVPGRDDHKYTRGVVGILAGSPRYPGAAVLSVMGALGTGCGMVRYLGADAVARQVLAEAPEVVTEDGRVQSLVLGSGVAGPDELQHLSERAARALADERVATVWDAGALPALPDDAALLRARRVVLTPHAGELATWLSARGEPVDRAGVESDPARWAVRAARLSGATVLLKGAVTVVADPAGALLSQDDATGWLATAGAGDVLGGVLGALLAGDDSGDPAELAAAAAWLHGRAARLASGGGPIVARDVARSLPRVVAGVLGGRAARMEP